MMSIAAAENIIRSLPARDRAIAAGGGGGTIRDSDGEIDALATIKDWLSSAFVSGESDLVEAIEGLGVWRASEVYVESATMTDKDFFDSGSATRDDDPRREVIADAIGRLKGKTEYLRRAVNDNSLANARRHLGEIRGEVDVLAGEFCERDANLTVKP